MAVRLAEKKVKRSGRRFIKKRPLESTAAHRCGFQKIVAPPKTTQMLTSG